MTIGDKPDKDAEEQTKIMKIRNKIQEPKSAYKFMTVRTEPRKWDFPTLLYCMTLLSYNY